MTKQELMDLFDAAKDLPMMAVVVATGQVQEAVVFTNPAFGHKRYYYERTYTDQLTKKENPHIRIVAAEAGHSIDLDILLQELPTEG